MFWSHCQGRMAVARGTSGHPSLVPSDVPECGFHPPVSSPDGGGILTSSSTWTARRDCLTEGPARGQRTAGPAVDFWSQSLDQEKFTGLTALRVFNYEFGLFTAKPNT